MTKGCKHTYGFTYMYQLPTYSHLPKQRQTDKLMNTLTYQRKQPNGI